MRKVAFIIITCLIAVIAQAQEPKEHLKFMGIELNGTIADFQTKLQAKGLTVSPQSKQHPTGVRVFDGTFSGEDAQIVVWYNPRTKEVYRAKAVISRYGKDLVEQLQRSMERKLDAKYGTEYKHSEEMEDDHLQRAILHKAISFSTSIIRTR